MSVVFDCAVFRVARLDREHRFEEEIAHGMNQLSYSCHNAMQDFGATLMLD